VSADDSPVHNYEFHIASTSAINGTGVVEAFHWIADRLKRIGR